LRGGPQLPDEFVESIVARVEERLEKEAPERPEETFDHDRLFP
jgi:hypothetical protein